MSPTPQFPSGHQFATPKTANELAALIERRDEIRNQLESATEARSDLAHQIEGLTSGELRAGPIARIRAADEEIARLSADLKTSNELITAAKARGLSEDDAGPNVIHIPSIQVGDMPAPIARFPGAMPPSWQDRLIQDLGTTVPITVATVVLLGAVFYWRIARTMRRQFETLIAAQSGHLSELQRSIDTVAVEVERVSENQRFVTKVVGEKQIAERQIAERR